MSRRRSPPRRPPGRGCSRRSSAQFAGKVHSSSCYCYYSHMAATSIPTLERRLRELLREHSVTRGDFTLASGRRSTFYIDARLTARGWAPDLVGGLTLGADPIAYAVAAAARAQGMPLDAFSVRKQAKAHGTGKRIEGCFRPGAAVVVVEDVITTGHSAAEAIAAVTSEGGRVLGVLAVVDREEGGRTTLEQAGHPVEALVTATDLGLR